MFKSNQRLDITPPSTVAGKDGLGSQRTHRKAPLQLTTNWEIPGDISKCAGSDTLVTPWNPEKSHDWQFI
jgi:hypothetical protein